MEYKIGEKFQWGDDLVRTVTDTDEYLGCEQCYFYHSGLLQHELHESK